MASNIQIGDRIYWESITGEKSGIVRNIVGEEDYIAHLDNGKAVLVNINSVRKWDCINSQK
jgi:hypothetical protein